jgi:hypothetical protein
MKIAAIYARVSTAELCVESQLYSRASVCPMVKESKDNSVPAPSNGGLTFQAGA